jgi:hypothetical protein
MDERSPTQVYLDSGRTLTNSRVASLLMTADQSHARRVDAVKDEPRLDDFMQLCRPATAMDYRAWLEGFLNRGGKVDNSWDFPIKRHRYLVLMSKTHTAPSLYGASSIQVIVPSGNLLPEELPDTFHGACGHSGFYFMDGYQAVTYFGISSYTDACVL